MPKKSEQMTPTEYANWIRNRGEIGTWNLDACRKADNFVKQGALDEFKKVLKREISDKHLRACTSQLVAAHFGSVEVDNLLQHFNCYAFLKPLEAE